MIQSAVFLKVQVFRPVTRCRDEHITVTEKMCAEMKGKTEPCGEGEEAKADPCGDPDNRTCRICLSDYKARRLRRGQKRLLGLGGRSSFLESVAYAVTAIVRRALFRSRWADCSTFTHIGV